VRSHFPKALLPLTVVCAVTATLTATFTGAVTGPANAAQPPRHISYAQWGTKAQFDAGRLAGVRVYNGKLRMDTPAGQRRYGGRSYDYSRWTSPWKHSGFGFTELVPAWAATTPGGSWIEVQVRGISEGGTRTSWDSLGRWSTSDSTFHRTSLGTQRDDLAHVATDTWEANYAGFTSWQLRLTMNRRAGTDSTPRVDTLGAMTSALPQVSTVKTSKPGVAAGITLNVPKYSQMTHAGEYPRYGGGGEAWCSPTSTTMVLAYYKRLPAAKTYAWVKRSYTNRFVDNTARMTFDYGYDGTGNWPFNSAYAATRTGHATVTRLHSLREAERFIKAGIPVVASITFGRGELDGAPISATNGHLVVIVGFTKAGNVVVNDPAAKSNASVRRTYRRGQFENAWLKRYPSNGSMRGSGGLVYIIRDAAHPLPPLTGNTNW
jgi:hypothetical protein